MTPHGTWSLDRRGSSGTWYRLTFHGQDFWRLQTRVLYSGPGQPWYWKMTWDRGRKGTQRAIAPRPRSPKVLAAFADLGIEPNAWISGKHARLAIVTGEC